MGALENAALPLRTFLNLPSSWSVPAADEDKVDGILAEFRANGSPEDLECLEYVLHGKAGEQPRKWKNGVWDEGRNGEVLDDFLRHPNAVRAQLSRAHVLALRLYTTAAYCSLNTPLRTMVKGGPAYLFPITLSMIAEGIALLRVLGQDRPTEVIELYRGMRNLESNDRFESEGGTELAPMSTTTDIEVATQYSMSPSSIIFVIRTENYMQRGADLSFLSAFPAEKEVLFPPRVYLCPTKRRQTIEVNGFRFCIIEVTPTYPKE